MRGQGVVGARTDVSQGPDARTSAADESVALRSSSPPVSSNPEMSPVDSGGRLYLFLRTQPRRGTGAGACLRKPPRPMRPASRRKPSYRERSIAGTDSNKDGSDDEHDFQNAGGGLSNLSGFP